jgi:hypothetical protein
MEVTDRIADSGAVGQCSARRRETARIGSSALPAKPLTASKSPAVSRLEHRRPNGLAVKGTAQSALSVSAQHGISGGDVLSRAGAM